MAHLATSKVSEKITVSNAAAGKGFTKATIDTMKTLHNENVAGVQFSVEGADIRYKVGIAPSATDGVLLAAGSTVVFDTEEEARGVLFIRDAAVDATVNAVFLKTA